MLRVTPAVYDNANGYMIPRDAVLAVLARPVDEAPLLAAAKAVLATAQTLEIVGFKRHERIVDGDRLVELARAIAAAEARQEEPMRDDITAKDHETIEDLKHVDEATLLAELKAHREWRRAVVELLLRRPVTSCEDQDLREEWDDDVRDLLIAAAELARQPAAPNQEKP